MNIVWRFFTVASLPVCVLYCLLYCSGPAVSGCGCLLVRAGDGWENPLPGCPGCPGFCSLCLSYRNRPVKPLALFLKKSRSPPRDPAMAVLGELVFPSAASLFGQATGPLGRPKKSDAPLLPHPPRPSDPSHCSPGGPGSDKHPPRPRQMRCRSPAPRAMWFHRRPTTSGRHRAGRVAAGPGQPCGPGCNPGTPAGGRGAPWRAHTPGPAGRSDRGADGPRAAVVVEAWVAWAIAGRGEATQVHRGQSFRPSANPLLVRPLRQKKTGDSRAAVPGFNGQKP